MLKLYQKIEEWFSKKKDYFEIFSEVDTRIEGWFKAELLLLFSRLKKDGTIQGFDREANIKSKINNKRKQIDFRLHFQNEEHLCELKAMCISQAAGTPRNLNFYFHDDNVGIIKDFRKLDTVPGFNKWVLAFIYPSPSKKDWLKVIKAVPQDLKHWQSLTSPKKSNRFVFISLWKC